MDLMDELFEHLTDHLHTRIPSMPSKVSPRSVVIPPRPNISSVKGNNLCLPLPSLLILLDTFVLVNSIYKLAHALHKLHC